MYSLRNGNKKSCGCYHIKQRHQKRKNDVFIEMNGYIVGVDENNKSFYIDGDDLDKIIPYYWSVEYNDYVTANLNNEKISLHRFIMGAQPGETIDHINRNPRDNRKINLRFCTDHQNTFNKKLSINNTSGKTGVCKEKDNRGKWSAYIFINGKNKRLGVYENFEDAVNVRIEAEKELFGEFSSSFDVELSKN